MNLPGDCLGELVTRHVARAATDGAELEDVVLAIAEDYLSWLTSQGVHIPTPVRPYMMGDVQEEIRALISSLTHTSSAKNDQEETHLSHERFRKVS